MDHPGARPPAGDRGILEERQIGARRALLVAIEQVVDARVVLVDALLHQAQAQHARVELDVAGRVTGDGGYVVDALELHVGLGCGGGGPAVFRPSIAASTSRRRSTSPRMPAAASLYRNASAR